ncbi:MAG TPA: DUF2505 domain-containing protein [Verrucomicrobiae bacterium]|nr:DUF2505 domain-containing protein [Verrucomicrobiae bacterium]
MKIDIKAKYPAPSATVLKMFMDKDFHTKKLKALGIDKSRVLDHAAAGDDFRIKIERKVPLAPPGGAVSKFLPAEATVVSEERWNKASKTGKVKIEPAGVPVEISCTAKFADDAGGCTITYAFDINAKIPLVGGTLEKFIASDMQAKFADEAKAAATLLDPYR